MTDTEILDQIVDLTKQRETVPEPPRAATRLDLVAPPYQCRDLYRVEANFGPTPGGAWWSHLACIEVAGLRVGDWLKCGLYLSVAGYKTQISAFVPAFITVGAPECPYDNAQQRARSTSFGKFVGRTGGENINNYKGGYYRPHICPIVEGWCQVNALPCAVHAWLVLSSFDGKATDVVELPKSGGSGQYFYVEHWRPVAEDGEPPPVGPSFAPVPEVDMDAEVAEMIRRHLPPRKGRKAR